MLCYCLVPVDFTHIPQGFLKGIWVILDSSDACEETLKVIGMNLLTKYRWFSARLQYLQCISTGDTAVMHLTINIV